MAIQFYIDKSKINLFIYYNKTTDAVIARNVYFRAHLLGVERDDFISNKLVTHSQLHVPHDGIEMYLL